MSNIDSIYFYRVKNDKNALQANNKQFKSQPLLCQNLILLEHPAVV